MLTMSIKAFSYPPSKNYIFTQIYILQLKKKLNIL